MAVVAERMQGIDMLDNSRRRGRLGVGSRDRRGRHTGDSAISGPPLGSGKGCGGLPARAVAMKSCQMRAGQRAAGHLVHRLVVVIADPDAGDQLGGEADEPGIAEILAGAGLAGDGPIDDCRLAGAAMRPPASSCPASSPAALAPSTRPARRRRAGRARCSGGRAICEMPYGHTPLPRLAKHGIGAGHLEQRSPRWCRARCWRRRQSGDVMPRRRAVSITLRRPDPLGHLHRDAVERAGEGVAQGRPCRRYLSSKLSAGQLPIAIGPSTMRAVRRQAVLERRPDRRKLEGRARLAQRLGGAVELAAA